MSEIVLGPSYGRANVILCGLSYNSINPINQIKVQSRPCFNKATKKKRFRTKLFSRRKPFPFAFWPTFVLPFSSSPISAGFYLKNPSFLSLNRLWKGAICTFHLYSWSSTSNSGSFFLQEVKLSSYHPSHPINLSYSQKPSLEKYSLEKYSGERGGTSSCKHNVLAAHLPFLFA